MSRPDSRDSARTVNDPEALRAEIERTRALLSETFGALAAKTDVKARARSAAGEAASSMKHQFRGARDRLLRVGSAKVALVAGGAALTAFTAILVTVVVRRRR